MNFANELDRVARNDPESLAVADPNRGVTFAELAAETDRFANALADLGVAPGDRVALYLPNSVAFVAAHLGAMKRGAIPFPINMRFEGNEVEYVLQDAGAVAAVTVGGFEDAIGDLDAGLDHLVVAGGSRGHDYRDLVGSADDEWEVHPRKYDETAELVYTSGTTGRPKGVEHTHRNLHANAQGLVRYLGWSDEVVGLTVAPMFHVSGLNITTTPLLYTGAENHVLPAWDAEDALALIEREGITDTFFIPTMLIDLLNRGVEDYDVSSMERIIVGGAPMPREQIAATEAAFDCTLLEGYGMTETTPLAAINTPGQDVYKPGSIGPPASEVVDVRIEDPETGEEVGTNEKGELLWHGDTVTPGYFGMPEKNEAAFVTREGKTWLRSGDVGRIDGDGHLFVEDRLDDMIISGGENVYPAEVEDALYELDGVVAVGVVGLPHDRLGEQVTAFVVRADDGLTEDELEDHCRGRLTDYKIPRRVEFVEDLPRTSTQKIDKVALRERLIGE
ncbi:AMP-dependent synthetase [Halobacteriales archaeon QS_8_69_26]|nr:MAG: AMP-dependent synthetase [Halobacteriales archaeon QS_8_69_26]